jgi:hypothetical protein
MIDLYEGYSFMRVLLFFRACMGVFFVLTKFQLLVFLSALLFVEITANAQRQSSVDLDYSEFEKAINAPQSYRLASMHNAEFMKPTASAETNVTLFKVPGVLPDATGCSVCASRVGYDPATGATVPGGSQCDPLINFTGAPDDTKEPPVK